MKLFGNLFAGLFGGGADEENSWDTEDALKLELEQAWDQVQKMAREQVARREKQLRTEEADENLKQTEHEKFQSELWESCGREAGDGQGLSDRAVSNCPRAQVRLPRHP